MVSWQEDQIQALLTVESDASFFSALSGIAIKLGFDYCAYGMRMPLPLSQPKLIMLNNYSDAWKKRYLEQNYLATDPTVAHGMRSTLPLTWTDEIDSKSLPFWEDARAHGLGVGWAQSCHDKRGIGGMLSLSRSDDQLSIKELEHITSQISWLVQTAHEGLSRLVVPRLMPEATANLTTREIEVLRWTADGKTSSEVGQIMNISERTVNFHVTNTLLKLGAANKTGAAIKAAILGLL
ncbi:autoinducer binding domain-containing protein [Glaciimonas immobilis]|uniref:LuxR family transcriptional regulator n=1 Tax=Glaciimonas immobilis TaxID=728004 RepID=A0A840S0V9_9BURK|nr:autoinducer binding domain-containing protein [Glaciimonas immobilis]KAF3996242.1 LuxR family transcriptional regulator [Glaciimonas immobilis]MBB5202351.1 LuxR family transcriptional regulator [Glaciimonas immobilis]